MAADYDTVDSELTISGLTAGTTGPVVDTHEFAADESVLVKDLSTIATMTEDTTPIADGVEI